MCTQIVSCLTNFEEGEEDAVEEAEEGGGQWDTIFATIAMQSISGFQRHSPLNTIMSTYLIFNSFGAPKLLFSMVVHIIVTFHC